MTWKNLLIPFINSNFGFLFICYLAYGDFTESWESTVLETVDVRHRTGRESSHQGWEVLASDITVAWEISNGTSLLVSVRVTTEVPIHLLTFAHAFVLLGGQAGVSGGSSPHHAVPRSRTWICRLTNLHSNHRATALLVLCPCSLQHIAENIR